MAQDKAITAQRAENGPGHVKPEPVSPTDCIITRRVVICSLHIPVFQHQKPYKQLPGTFKDVSLSEHSLSSAVTAWPQTVAPETGQK